MKNELNDGNLNKNLDYLKISNPIITSLADRVIDSVSFSNKIKEVEVGKGVEKIKIDNQTAEIETLDISQNEVCEKISSIRDIVEIAESRIYRQKLPENILNSLSFLRPVEKQILRFFSLIFRDQTEVNTNIVNALKEMLVIKQSVLDIVAAQKSYISKLDNRLVSQIKCLDENNVLIKQHISSGTDHSIESLLAKIASLENQLEETIENHINTVVEEKISPLNTAILDFSVLLDSLRHTTENEASKIVELETSQQAISTKLDNIQEIYQNTANTSKIPLEQARIQQGFWFNEPIVTAYQSSGKVEWVTTTERIIEKTFVEQSLCRLYTNKDFKILDIGAAESILSYELASFGYSVTAIDIRPISLFHPNLKFVQCDICEPVFDKNTFDCAIALSTIEHIGLGWYGDEKGDSLDKKAVNTIFNLLKDGGYFILTVPYGKKAVTPVHRIYDKSSLSDLLARFSSIEIKYGVRQDKYTWMVTDEEARAANKEHDPVSLLPSAAALIICRKI